MNTNNLTEYKKAFAFLKDKLERDIKECEHYKNLLKDASYYETREQILKEILAFVINLEPVEKEILNTERGKK